MPRKARQDSLNGKQIYHIIIKGINSQEIFYEASDKVKMLKLLNDSKEIYTYEIYAYVLMDNHIHLIIYDKENNISLIMHRICCIYAMYFNQKYKRTGHLFQNRFKSICVETEKYLLNLQRYIHKNPEKDGIEKIDRYKWSSYHEYITTENVVNIKFILDIFDKDRKKAIKKFIQYNKMNEEEYGIGNFEIRKTLSDEEAIETVRRILNIDNIMIIQNLKGSMRDKYIKEIFEIKGISKRQIARITGISARTIQRAITGK